MHTTVQLDSIFIALAVLMFVFFAIAMLIIVDHKAKIPGLRTDDLVSISGERASHPIWAWLVSAMLWTIILLLLGASLYKMFGHRLTAAPEENILFTTLDKEHGAERVRHFHNLPASNDFSQGVQPICYACHGEYPHSSKPMVRTLLNMHTQFAGCMTCHADDAKIPEQQIKLRWLNYSGIAVQGKPFGIDVNPATGSLAPTDDYFSKIVPYRMRADGSEELLEITEESEDARNFLAVRGQLTAQQQGAIKKMFHATVNPVGRFCTRCHTEAEDSYIPFRELGFSEARVSALTNVNIVGIVQKYREFYMPTLFYGNGDNGQKEVLLGKEVALPPPSREMHDDPRSWWRNNYDKSDAH